MVLDQNNKISALRGGIELNQTNEKLNFGKISKNYQDLISSVFVETDPSGVILTTCESRKEWVGQKVSDIAGRIQAHISPVGKRFSILEGH